MEERVFPGQRPWAPGGAHRDGPDRPGRGRHVHPGTCARMAVPPSQPRSTRWPLRPGDYVVARAARHRPLRGEWCSARWPAPPREYLVAGSTPAEQARPARRPPVRADRPARRGSSRYVGGELAHSLNKLGGSDWKEHQGQGPQGGQADRPPRLVQALRGPPPKPRPATAVSARTRPWRQRRAGGPPSRSPRRSDQLAAIDEVEGATWNCRRSPMGPGDLRRRRLRQDRDRGPGRVSSGGQDGKQVAVLGGRPTLAWPSSTWNTRFRRADAAVSRSNVQGACSRFTDPMESEKVIAGPWRRARWTIVIGHAPGWLQTGLRYKESGPGHRGLEEQRFRRRAQGAHQGPAPRPRGRADHVRGRRSPAQPWR